LFKTFYQNYLKNWSTCVPVFLSSFTGYCCLMRNLVSLFTLVIFIAGCQTGNPDKNYRAGFEDDQDPSVKGLPGIIIESDQLQVRFVDNSARFIHISDSYQEGMNGIASLIHRGQGKNIFASAGMNLECTHTDPPHGKLKDLWNAPRIGPMKMEQVDPVTVKYTQKATEVSGLNMEMLFTVGGSFIDQTITTWPDHHIESSSSFFASYMNQVQNTSLFIRTPEGQDGDKQWLEITSAGHNASDGTGVFCRPFDPVGLNWDEHLKDNPLLRQGIIETPGSRQATLDAGFSEYPSKKMDHFYYGFVDSYVYLMIFKEPEFIFWISASGGQAVRSPAWDYEFRSGPQKAGEKRDYHLRLVYKPFESIEDILMEADRFLSGAHGGPSGGN